jgi:hypothetical protein
LSTTTQDRLARLIAAVKPVVGSLDPTRRDDIFAAIREAELPLVSLGQGEYTHDLAGRANASLDQAANAPLPVATRRTVAAVGGQITPPTPTTPPTPELAMLPHPDREMLASAATTLHRIAQEAAGALGLLARAGIKPLE